MPAVEAKSATGRVYQGGRTTIGWRPGPKVTAVTEVEVGDILISVSHQFKAQNLVKVTRIKNSPVHVEVADKFYVRYCTPSQELTGAEVICVWGFDLAPRDNPSLEYFKAELVGKEAQR